MQRSDTLAVPHALLPLTPSHDPSAELYVSEKNPIPANAPPSVTVRVGGTHGQQLVDISPAGQVPPEPEPEPEPLPLPPPQGCIVMLAGQLEQPQSGSGPPNAGSRRVSTVGE